MNSLQVQLAQNQEALRQSELERQKGRHCLTDVEARCRQLNFRLSQSQCTRKDLTTRLHVAVARYTEMRVLIEVQEASKVNSERQVSEGWRTIERLTEIIQGLRNHLDSKKLSAEEQTIDVAGVFLEKERLQSQVQDLKHSLADFQATTEAATRRLASQLTVCQSAVRSKDERILELERFCAQTKQEVQKTSRSSRRIAVGL